MADDTTKVSSNILIFEALKNSQDSRGLSIKNVVDYVSLRQGYPEQDAKILAHKYLQHAVTCGAVEKKGNRYYLVEDVSNPEDFEDLISQRRRCRRRRRRRRRGRCRRRRRRCRRRRRKCRRRSRTYTSPGEEDD